MDWRRGPRREADASGGTRGTSLLEGSKRMKKSIQLPLQTGDLIVGFMVWVILS